jgi:hypothetical protein
MEPKTIVPAIVQIISKLLAPPLKLICWGVRAFCYAWGSKAKHIPQQSKRELS